MEQCRFKVGDKVVPDPDGGLFEALTELMKRKDLNYFTVVGITQIGGNVYVQYGYSGNIGYYARRFKLYQEPVKQEPEPTFVVPELWLTDWVHLYCPIGIEEEEDRCELEEYIKERELDAYIQERVNAAQRRIEEKRDRLVTSMYGKKTTKKTFPWYDEPYEKGDVLRPLHIDELEQRTLAEGIERGSYFWEKQEELLRRWNKVNSDLFAKSSLVLFVVRADSKQGSLVTTANRWIRPNGTIIHKGERKHSKIRFCKVEKEEGK